MPISPLNRQPLLYDEDAPSPQRRLTGASWGPSELEEEGCCNVEAACRCFGACQGGARHDVRAAHASTRQLLAWLVVHVFLFAAMRVCVAARLPADGIRGWMNTRFACETLERICLYACGSACFAHVLTPRRRLFTKPSAAGGFFVVAFGTGIAFALASDAKPLQHSLSYRDEMDASFAAALACCGAVILAGFAFHLWLAARDGGVGGYLLPRLAVLGAYGAYAGALVLKGDDWELHHYLIAWVASLFCCFDHPVSIVCLAACTGIFAQGISAYGAATMADGSYKDD